MKTHPIHSKDPNVCCKWLCESAGLRSNTDNLAIQEALEDLPHQGKALPGILFKGYPRY